MSGQLPARNRSAPSFILFDPYQRRPSGLRLFFSLTSSGVQAMNNTPVTARILRRSGLLSRLLARPLLWRMMLRQGIDPGERWWHGAEGLLDRIITRCHGCSHTSECHSWLSHSAAHSTPPDFCRNRRTLTACRILAAGHVPERTSDLETEPTVSELTGEPIVRQLMTADGVETRDVQAIVAQAGRAREFKA